MNPGLFARLFIALGAFFRILFDARYAGSVRQLTRGRPMPTPAPAGPAAPSVESPPSVSPTAVTVPAPPATDASALVLLGALQREGRFVDFVMEEIRSYSDAEVGAAVRIVHEGCRKVLREQTPMEPVRRDAEGAAVLLPPGFDASEVRLVGNVRGGPPFTGALRHHGWRVVETRLPRPVSGTDVRVVMPAEVEL